MKKFSWIFALILALSMAFIFAGCGEEPSNPGVNDGTGPGVRYKFSSLVLPSGTPLNDAALAPFNLKVSGNALITYADGVLTVDPDGNTDTYHALDVLNTAWSTFEPPFDITFKGTAVDSGTLKLGQAGPSYGNIKVGTPMVGGDEFEITSTITKTNVDGMNGIRIQSNGTAAMKFELTEILIVK